MKRKLLDYCEISGKAVHNFEDEKRYIATGDVVDGQIVSGEMVTFANKPSRANQEAEMNELLFAKMKGTKKVIQIDKDNKNFIYSTGFYIMKAKKNIYHRYLFWFFNSNYFNAQKDNNCTGATMKGINNSGLKSIEINEIPNFEDQTNRCNNLDKIYETIKSRKETVNLLQNLIDSKFAELFGNIIKNDRDFEKKCWYEILKIKNGKTQSKVVSADGKYPIYGSGGTIGRANEYLCKENSIIIGRKGNIDKPLYVKEKFWNVDTAFGVEVGKELNSIYFFKYCQMFNFQQYNKAVTIPSLTKSDLLKIEMPVPDITLQEQFANYYEKAEKVINILATDISDLYLLLESKMHEYFD